jgi:Domain of unknown function (DUF4380)
MTRLRAAGGTQRRMSCVRPSSRWTPALLCAAAATWGTGCTGAGAPAGAAASAGSPASVSTRATDASGVGGYASGHGVSSAAGDTPGAAAGVAASSGSGGASATAAAVSGGSGGGSAAAANGGGSAGAGAPETLVLPIVRDGKYVLEFGDLRLEVEPQVGGRISLFGLDGQNLLTGPEVDSGNWGSTFWPSPQQRWDWPPVPEIDNQPYTASLEGSTIVLTGAAGVRAKVSVTKRISALLSKQAVEISYVLSNTDTAAASWAPWEITRVAPNGITFFPAGSKTVSTELPVMNSDGIIWYAHEPAKLPTMGQKYSADGSAGWLAHVAGATLFLKTFTDVPVDMQAPAPEAEIAIYAAPSYVELEPQGPYTQLMPGASVSWTVRWYARALPSGLEARIGNSELVKLAAALAIQ